MRYWCWFIFFLSGTEARVQAQSTNATALPAKYNIRNIDNNNGLNSNDVYAITQDRKGYIWIGTEKGLQRYDGLRFMDCFSTAVTIGSQQVYYLYPDDAQGRIWYDQPDRRLRQWSFLTNSSIEIMPEALVPAGTGTQYRDWKNKAWTITPYWLDSSQQDGDRQGTALLKEPGDSHYRPVSFIKDERRRQTWLIDSAYGLLLLNDKDRTLSSTAFNPGNDPLLSGLKTTNPAFRKIATDRHGNIWLLSWTQEFYRYDRTAQKLFTYSLAAILEQEGNQRTLPCWVSDILEDNHDILWLATAQAGLLEYDFKTSSFRYLLRQPGNNLALQYNHQINALFQDREENIWLGTDRGICIFNPYRQYFSTLNNQDTGRLSRTVNEIAGALISSKKELWVGSWGGGGIFNSPVTSHQ